MPEKSTLGLRFVFQHWQANRSSGAGNPEKVEKGRSGEIELAELGWTDVILFTFGYQQY